MMRLPIDPKIYVTAYYHLNKRCGKRSLTTRRYLSCQLEQLLFKVFSSHFHLFYVEEINSPF